MKILLLSWRGIGHPHAGGAEISTHEHAKAWVRAGHEVTLFTSRFPGSKNEVVDGVKFIRTGRQIFGVQFLAAKWYLFQNKEKFDLVIDQFHGIPFFTPLYARAKKLAFIHEVAKEVWRMNHLPRPYNLVPAILGPAFEKYIFKLFYKNIPFMTVSRSTKSDLVEWGIPAKNITVVENGIKSVKAPHLEKEKKPTLIFLGALSKDKGAEDVLKIFTGLVETNKNWQFWIVGKGAIEYVAELKKKSEKPGLKKNLRFWGYVSERQKFELLKKAHLLINPSIREGWGLVNIEANSMGTPVIAFDVPGSKDSVKNGKSGYLLPLHDIDGVVNKVEKLISDKKLYQQIQKNAISWAKTFSWEKSAKKSLKLIETI